MKKSLRLALTAAVLLSVGTMPVFATMSGGDPYPPSTKSASNSAVVMSAVLSAFGL